MKKEKKTVKKSASSSVKTAKPVVVQGKTPKKCGANDQKSLFAQIAHVILGIGQLLVVVSIIYSTAIVIIGMNSVESRILLVPQVVFALVILVKAFSKLNK